jgi:hypothetical protein
MTPPKKLSLEKLKEHGYQPVNDYVLDTDELLENFERRWQRSNQARDRLAELLGGVEQMELLLRIVDGRCGIRKLCKQVRRSPSTMSRRVARLRARLRSDPILRKLVDAS